MILSNKTKNRGVLQAQVLIEELVRQGVDTFFVAPGSRSTPLVAAVVSNPRARAIVHFDERGTSFAALGFGKATGRPAAWITTSGSAVANGYPAVIEAFSDQIPVLLLTADRPKELRGNGSNQTIDQIKIFGEYVHYFADLPTPSTESPLRSTIRIADQAVEQSLRASGPVHLNCPFREPFFVDESIDWDAPIAGQDVGDLVSWYESGDCLITLSEQPTIAPAKETIADLKATIAEASRGLTVVGAMTDRESAVAAQELCNQIGWPTLVDPLSQLRSGTCDVHARVDYYDQLLAASSFADRAVPDAIVHVGGRLISKRLVELISRSSSATYWRVGVRYDYNPRERSCHVLTGDLDLIASELEVSKSASGEVAPDEWHSFWSTANKIVGELLDEPNRLAGEAQLARRIGAHLPGEWSLFVGNSMPVRMMDGFSTLGSRSSIYANRGASGIDGNLATTFGISLGAKQPVLALIGDLAFLHDLNSLALLRQSEYPIVIIVVNNDGGGIFSFLPIASQNSAAGESATEQSRFEQFFATPHGMEFSSVANQFGLDYKLIPGEEFTPDFLQNVIATGVSQVIEVTSRRSDNVATYSAISDAIDKRMRLG